MPIGNLDVVTTATLRPELLELTYRSFYNRFFKKIKHCRLIINIDPVPTRDERQLNEILSICHYWFPEVIYRHPLEASFPAAVQWAWSQTETEYVFHLEDDWLLTKQINPELVIKYFSEAPQLAEVTLNPSRNKGGTGRLSLRPSFFRKTFIDSALPLFDLSLDPEKQWNGHTSAGGKLDSWIFREYGEIGDGRHMREIGAAWRKRLNLVKWGQGETSWKIGKMSSMHLNYSQLKYLTYRLLWSKLAGSRPSTPPHQSEQA